MITNAIKSTFRAATGNRIRRGEVCVTDGILFYNITSDRAGELLGEKPRRLKFIGRRQIFKS